MATVMAPITASGVVARGPGQIESASFSGTAGAICAFWDSEFGPTGDRVLPDLVVPATGAAQLPFLIKKSSSLGTFAFGVYVQITGTGNLFLTFRHRIYDEATLSQLLKTRVA